MVILMEYTIRERDASGKLVDAKVFLDKFAIDKGTMDQIKRIVLDDETVSHTRIMPDCHKGVGCCVGLTSVLIDKVRPNLVGGDIGCGILCYNAKSHLNDISLPKLDRVIREAVPMGSKSGSIAAEVLVREDDYEYLFSTSNLEAIEFSKHFLARYGVDISKFKPDYNKEWFDSLITKIAAEKDYALRSIGTLGGGNHYIEINSDAAGNRYVTIHSGSRNLGSKIKQYHQDKIDTSRRFDYREHQDKMKKYRRTHKNSKDVKHYEDSLYEEFRGTRHKPYLEGEEAYEYYFDMIFAQIVARLNRRVMLREILERIDDSLKFEESDIIESIHNYIDFKDFILRKGAISAHEGERCIVSLNMKEGILICTGKGNYDWNYSSAHGAGRMLTRDAARSRISLKEFRESMSGVYSSSVVQETVDESPMVYKDSEMIKKALEGSVTIDAQLRPLLNVKALT